MPCPAGPKIISETCCPMQKHSQAQLLSKPQLCGLQVQHGVHLVDPARSSLCSRSQSYAGTALLAVAKTALPAAARVSPRMGAKLCEALAGIIFHGQVVMLYLAVQLICVYVYSCVQLQPAGWPCARATRYCMRDTEYCILHTSVSTFSPAYVNIPIYVMQLMHLKESPGSRLQAQVSAASSTGKGSTHCHSVNSVSGLSTILSHRRLHVCMDITHHML